MISFKVNESSFEQPTSDEGEHVEADDEADDGEGAPEDRDPRQHLVQHHLKVQTAFCSWSTVIVYIRGIKVYQKPTQTGLRVFPAIEINAKST